jgi:hypothetical protein
MEQRGCFHYDPQVTVAVALEGSQADSLRRDAMTANSKVREPRSRKPAHSSEIEERIRRCAYQLYVERGRVDGFALDDWLKAEEEILGAQKPKIKAAKGSN